MLCWCMVCYTLSIRMLMHGLVPDFYVWSVEAWSCEFFFCVHRVGHGMYNACWVSFSVVILVVPFVVGLAPLMLYLLGMLLGFCLVLSQDPSFVSSCLVSASQIYEDTVFNLVWSEIRYIHWGSENLGTYFGFWERVRKWIKRHIYVKWCQ